MSDRSKTVKAAITFVAIALVCVVSALVMCHLLLDSIVTSLWPAAVHDPPTLPGLYELKFRCDSTYTVMGKAKVDTVMEWYTHVCYSQFDGIIGNGW